MVSYVIKLSDFKSMEVLTDESQSPQRAKNRIANLPSHFVQDWELMARGKVECLDEEISLPSIPNHQVDKAEILLYGQCEECAID